ncbi:MAG: AAA family ATPase [Myxococcales bacterium]|nr:AAA family ATPase [Myxococcales bacterium]
MEWVEGETLRARLARGRLTAAAALPLFRRLAEALAHIHAAGFVHRDLKPANVLLPGSDLGAAIIADLGLARGASDASATATGAAIGTPAYMAPEQARGDKALRATADVFSLGALMYECLAGRPPFRGDSVIAVLTSLLTARPEPLARSAAVSRRLDATVQGMLSRDPRQRPSDGAAVLRALEGLDDEVELTSPVPPVEVRGELRPATILLARTRTTLARADAETVTLAPREGLAPPHIDELFAPFGCALEVLEGGTLVGVFSRSPSPRDQATLAARAALALRAALPAYCVTLTTGRALAGGARDSLAADTAEAALTMLGTVEPDAVYTDDVTAALLAARFFTEPRRTLTAVLGERGDEAPRAVRGHPVPFVGRDLELGTLDLTFRTAVEEQTCRVAIVLAPAGAGKTRLLGELRHRLEDHGAGVVGARCDPQTSGVPYGLLAGLVASSFSRVRPGEARSGRRAEALEALAAQRESLGPDVVERLSELVRVATSPDGRFREPDPHIVRRGIVAATARWLSAAAAPTGVALIVDDGHWADAPTLEVLDEVLAKLPSSVGAFIFARPEIDGLHPRLFAAAGSQRIVLAKLRVRAAEAMLRAAIADLAPTLDVVRRLAELGDGNPLFLEELARAARPEAMVPSTTPKTIQTMLQARCTAVPADARRALRAASVLGLEFDREALSYLLESTASADDSVDSPAVLDALDLLSREELIDGAVAGPTLRFRHPLVHEAAYGLVAPEERVLLHARAFEIGLRRGTLRPSELAEHAGRAGRHADEARWRVRAAEMSFAANDMAGALAHAERAMVAAPTSEVLGLSEAIAAIAAFFLGDMPRAFAWGTAAVGHAPAESTWWVRCLGNLSAMCAHAHGAEVPRATDPALDRLLVREPGDGEWAAVLEALAITVNADAGYYLPRASASAARLQALLERCPPTEHVARGWAHHGLGWHALLAGHGTLDPVEEAERSVAAFALGNDMRNLVAARAFLGVALAEGARTTPAQSKLALEASAWAIRDAEAQGGGFPLMYARLLLGDTLVALTELELAPPGAAAEARTILREVHAALSPRERLRAFLREPAPRRPRATGGRSWRRREARSERAGASARVERYGGAPVHRARRVPRAGRAPGGRGGGRGGRPRAPLGARPAGAGSPRARAGPQRVDRALSRAGRGAAARRRPARWVSLRARARRTRCGSRRGIGRRPRRRSRRRSVDSRP